METTAERITSFGTAIRRRRQAQELTLDDLADRSGLTPNYVGSVENGRRDPSLSTVMALAQGLRIQAAELFGDLPTLSAAAVEGGRLVDESPTDIKVSVLALLRAMVARVMQVGRRGNRG